MATLEIEGRKVQVDDSFLSLSPDEQAATVDEIAASFGAPTSAPVQQPQEQQAPSEDVGVLEKIKSGLRLANPVMGAAQYLGDKIGNNALGITNGIIDSGVSAVTAPGRAMDGTLPMTGPDGSTSPEAISEAINMAGWIMPGATFPKATGTREAALKAAETITGTEGNKVALAANRVGVDIPNYMVSDSKIVQSTAKGLENQPLVGSPLLDATDKLRTQLADKVTEVGSRYGKGSPSMAGSMARENITDYGKNILSGRVKEKYDAVDAFITPNVVTPIAKTRQAAGEILGKIAQSQSTRKSAAVERISKAAMDPNGLTYEGIKTLRSEIGDLLADPAKLAAQGMDNGDLKLIYAALSDDLRSSVVRSGGKEALAKFEEANAFAAKTQAEKKALDTVLGSAQKSDESIFSTIKAMAGTTSRADIKKLMLARRAVGDEAWDEVASGVIDNMGRDAAGEFSFDRYITARSKISPSGKKALFGTTGKGELAKTLDDIDTIVKRTSAIEKKYGNPSGTARNMGLVALGAGLVKAPTTVLSGVLGGRFVASALAKPASAKKVADYMRAYEASVTLPGKSSNAMLERAARLLAIEATGGDVNAAQSIIGKLISPNKAPANNEQNNGIGYPEGQPQSGNPDQRFNDAYLQGRAL